MYLAPNSAAANGRMVYGCTDGVLKTAQTALITPAKRELWRFRLTFTNGAVIPITLPVVVASTPCDITRLWFANDTARITRDCHP